MKWKEIDLNLYVAEVPGGWLVKYDSAISPNYTFQGNIPVMGSTIASITFVPDPDHSWEPLKA